MQKIFKKYALTPTGTPPQPVRRSTKRKQWEYGAHLMAKNNIRKTRKVLASSAALLEDLGVKMGEL